jgi:hypothetical protein
MKTIGEVEKGAIKKGGEDSEERQEERYKEGRKERV